ncbi:MAG: hypothetical protein QOF28_766 [Actinomycetota bacterium]|nr:hypothetical protein [Actinomycetota bacterium]
MQKLERVVVLFSGVALALSGCGGSAKKVDPAADLRVAKSAVLVAADVPSGFTGTPHTNSDDLPASAKKAFAECMHADATLFDDTPGAQKADSADFKKGDDEIDSSVEIDPKKKDIDKGYEQMAQSQTPACLGQLFDSAIKSSAGSQPGVTYGTVKVTRASVTGIGDRGFTFSGTIPITAQSQALTFYFDVLLVQRDRAGITISTFQTNAPLDHDTELRLVRTVVDRVGDGAK